MSNLETSPAEIDCNSDEDPHASTAGGTIAVEILTARDVPLGGPRAMTVHRTLPQRGRSLVGAWCFADHYGPDDVSVTGGMDVPPHPHTGLQTVSWLFTGEIEHRDTMGNHAMVRPGEINLMTAGHGIAHTEVSTPETTVLHGVQLWVALPSESMDTARDFAHYAPATLRRDGVDVKVFLGDLFGSVSPVHTFTPLLGAELVFEPGASLDIAVKTDFEHGILVDTGTFAITNAGAGSEASGPNHTGAGSEASGPNHTGAGSEASGPNHTGAGSEASGPNHTGAGSEASGPNLTGDTVIERTEMGYVGLGASTISLTNRSEKPGRVILLGGEPLGEDIIMWWNFIGRTHDDIVGYRDEWMAHSERFGQVHGYDGDIQHLPAPALPHSHLKPRQNTPGHA